MADNWQSLVANLAVVALFISGWVHGQFIFAGRSPQWRLAAFGVTMGLGAVVSMLLAIPIGGVLFDLHLSLIALASFFGGPLASAIAAFIAIAYRVWVVGGPAALPGTAGICLAALMGLAVSRGLRDHLPALTNAVILAVGVAAVSLGWTMLYETLTPGSPSPLPVPVALMNAAATLLSALFVMRNRVLERERDLLREAFRRSPDFQYVKTTESRFAAVNDAVARHHGFADPADMVGKSDLDVDAPQHARDLMAAEQALLKDGKPMSDLEEMVVGPNGEATWFLTSKVPLHNTEGKVIGLAGVTRDITARKLLEEELVSSRNQLSYVLAEITDGIAMFDQSGVLLYCNDRYRDMFPLTANVRRPGVNIRTILKAIAEAGEQNGIPETGFDEWVEKVVKTEALGSEAEVNLSDGRWLQLRTRPTSNGFVLVVVSDMTKTKQAEAALRAFTEQLTLLATTDGLTGLANRLAFDQALKSEIARSRRDGTPLSLLMIDVDRFKLYNDDYGHPAGDEALRTVGQCLKQALKRPGDLAARYGGEEFAAILPGCTEDEALFIAEGFRDELKERAIRYASGIGGTLTVSVGLAIFDQAHGALSASDLVGRADEALYDAKDAGRDRVMGWRAREDTRLGGRIRAGE